MRYQPLLLLLLLLAAAPAPTLADAPDFITYSGRLADGTGWGQTLQLDLTMSLHSSDTEGSKLWEQAFLEVTVTDGYFSVVLEYGDNPGTPEVEVDYAATTVFKKPAPTWVGISVGGNPELTPRLPIGRVPMAVNASTLGAVDGIGRVNGKLVLWGSLTLPGPQVGGPGEVKEVDLMSSGAAGDGFRMRYAATSDGNLEPYGLDTNDVMLFEKTDGEPAFVDGAMVFANTGSNGTVVPALVIRGNGRVGIGTGKPAAKLHVAGDLKADGVCCTSTIEHKKDVRNLSTDDQDQLLSSLRELNLVYFRYKQDDPSRPRRLGVIAERAPKQIVSPDGKSVSLPDFVSLVAGGLKSLDENSVKLAKEVGRLRAENSALRDRLSALELRFSNLERAEAHRVR